MTSIFTRLTTGGLIAAAVAVTALATGAGPSTAAPDPNDPGDTFGLYCYQNAGHNSERLQVDGFRKYANPGVLYQGRTRLQTWNGRVFVYSDRPGSIDVFKDVWSPDFSANTACGEITQEVGLSSHPFGLFV